MKVIHVCLFALLATVFVSCNKKEKEIQSIQAMAASVDSMMQAAPVLGPEQRVKADELVERYTEFAEEYPQDSLAPVYLFKASFVAGAIPEYKEQIALFDKIIAGYPGTSYAPQALALAAKSYADYFQDREKAKEYLLRLKNEYPESPYSVNIDMQIEYIGDDEGLFEATMQKRAEMDSINAVKQGTAK